MNYWTNSKALSVSNLNEFGDEVIKQYNSYSTSEKFTGEYWIDGKPIYKKVFTGTTVAGDTSVNMSSLNIRQLVNITGVIGQNDEYKPINFTYDNYKISTRYSNGTMYINASNVYANLTFYLIVEYTKTTD